MKCEEAINIHLLTLSDEATVEQTDALNAHLNSCSACRREVEEVTGILGIYHSSTSTPTLPGSIRESILSSVQVSGHSSRPRILMLGVWITAVAAALILSFIIIDSSGVNTGTSENGVELLSYSDSLSSFEGAIFDTELQLEAFDEIQLNAGDVPGFSIDDLIEVDDSSALDSLEEFNQSLSSLSNV